MAKRNVPIFDSDISEGLFASAGMPAANYNKVRAPILPSFYNVHRMDLFINSVYISTKTAPFSGSEVVFEVGERSLLDIPQVIYYNYSGNIVYIAQSKCEKRKEFVPTSADVSCNGKNYLPNCIHGFVGLRSIVRLGEFDPLYKRYQDFRNPNKLQLFRYEGDQPFREWFITKDWSVLSKDVVSVFKLKTTTVDTPFYNFLTASSTQHPQSDYSQYFYLDTPKLKLANAYMEHVKDIPLTWNSQNHGWMEYYTDGLDDGTYFVTLNSTHLSPFLTKNLLWLRDTTIINKIEDAVPLSALRKIVVKHPTLNDVEVPWHVWDEDYGKPLVANARGGHYHIITLKKGEKEVECFANFHMFNHARIAWGRRVGRWHFYGEDYVPNQVPFREQTTTTTPLAIEFNPQSNSYQFSNAGGKGPTSKGKLPEKITPPGSGS